MTTRAPRNRTKVTRAVDEIVVDDVLVARGEDLEAVMDYDDAVP